MFKMFYLTLTHAGYLQILFLAGAINRPICQWTEIGAGFINNTEVTPCHSLIQGKTKSIDVMWVKCGEKLNHVIPLIPGSGMYS